MRIFTWTQKIISHISLFFSCKGLILFLIFIHSSSLFSQSLQLQYDFRHSMDPQNNKSNFPSLFFELFKLVDYGSFFVKTQADFFGDHHNIGQFYMQISRDFKFWDPLFFLHIEYSGGVGVAEGTSYGYYVGNAYLFGSNYAFQWGNDWQSISLCYRYSLLNRPSHDAQVTAYWSKHLLEDRFTFAGSFVLFTQNRDRGDDLTKNLTGKKVFFWGQPQIWINVTDNFFVGSQITLYYHIYSYSENLLVYPALAMKYQF